MLSFGSLKRYIILVFGFLYFGYALFVLAQVPSLLKLYQEFSVELPLTSYLGLGIYFLIIIFGLLQMVLFLKKLKSGKVYEYLLIADVVLLLLGVLFYVVGYILPIYNLESSL